MKMKMKKMKKRTARSGLGWIGTEARRTLAQLRCLAALPRAIAVRARSVLKPTGVVSLERAAGPLLRGHEHTLLPKPISSTFETVAAFDEAHSMAQSHDCNEPTPSARRGFGSPSKLPAPLPANAVFALGRGSTARAVSR